MTSAADPADGLGIGGNSMCGIAGVVAWDDRYRVGRDTLGRMSARIAHRGPDGEGFFLNHEQEVTPDRPQCGFAFRRLAILDPDPRAMQPFTIGDKTIVFNGEVYNFRELRAELTTLRPDYAWRTTGDTEVLLLAYDVWGGKCLGRLNGMFAFAVWDERDKSLFLARDRMGQKPLYLAFGGLALVESLVNPAATSSGGIPFVAFASEITAMRELPFIPAGIDRRAVADYLRWGYVASPSTVSPAIQKIMPGWSQFFRFDTYAPARYFDPNVPGTTSPPRTSGEVRRLIEQAVRRQLVSDVPLGCFLSGGVDSSIVTLCMAKALGDPGRVSTFSIGFEDPRYDERDYAAALARHVGTRHRQFVVSPPAAEDLPRLARAFGEPFADSSALPVHYLSRETRQHVKVALAGDGSDELFGGYERYRAMRLGERVARLPAPVRRALAVSTWGVRASHPKSLSARLARFTRTLGRSSADRYAGYLRVFDDDLLDELMPGAPAEENTFTPRPTYERVLGGRDVVTAALATDRLTYLPEDLHTKVDRASMLHGLEVRSPFMDHELVTFAAGLTTDQLLKGGPKRMLREAFADDLPAWVFKRKKMGFAVPIGEWFRGGLRPMLRDNLFAGDSFAREHFDMAVVARLVDEHETRRVDHSQRLYALLMLELWWRAAR